MFGRKRIEELEKRVTNLGQILDREMKSNEMMWRIIRNAKDNEPTFLVDIRRVYNEYEMWSDEVWVYLYIGKMEYEIHLDEYDDSFIYPFQKYFKLRVEGDLAYLTYDEPKTNFIYEFTINYIRGIYVSKKTKKGDSENA